MGCTVSHTVVETQQCAAYKDDEAFPSIFHERLSGQQATFHSSYVLGRKLGKGAFSKVYLAEKVSQGEKVAVKVTDMRLQQNGVRINEMDQKALRACKKEVDIMRNLDSHNQLIKVFDSHIEEPFSYIVMELCRFTLLHAFERMPELNEHTYAPIVRQMLQALDSIHRISIVHRDIKPDNFLCTYDNNVKLCDFGLAEVVPPNAKLGGVYGTAPFMSPEMLGKEGYDTKVDLWSLGVLVYTLMIGQFPYMPAESGPKTAKAMKAAILVGTPPPSFEAKPTIEKTSSQPISTSAKGFLQVLLNRNPAKRPTAGVTLQHPWLSPAYIPGTEQPPSLRSRLYAGKRVGFFDIRNGLDSKDTDGMDKMLEKLQAQAHGCHLINKSTSPAAWHIPNSMEHIVPMADGHKCGHSVAPSDVSTAVDSRANSSRPNSSSSSTMCLSSPTREKKHSGL